MDTRFIIFWLQALLCMSAVQAAPVSENFVVSVRANVTVHTKQTAMLPCWLSPQQSAEEMEVNWFYSDQFDAPVMLYKDKVLNTASQLEFYSGRVSFGQKDTSSGGLRNGDVTLKMINVSLADAGEYTCYVSSEKHHDRASFNLIVTKTGESPLLTAVVRENNKVNVSCESSGWHPQPKLQWSDGGSVLDPEALVYSKASSGLVSVHSWVLVSHSSEVSCAVGLPGQEAIEGRIRVQTPELQTQHGSSSLVAGWVLFAFAAVALAALLGFVCFKNYKAKRSTLKTDNANSELEKLLSKDFQTVLNEANYVNVTLMESNNEYITIRDNIVRDNRKCNFPDGAEVTCLTAVRGTPGFSSGKHYWAVSLAKSGITEIPVKRSWWIGVTNHTVIPTDHNLALTADNGFWFLSSSPETRGVLKFSSNPPIYQGASVMPRTVGVYLDYDAGELGFYNMEDKSLIGFFSAKFSREVFPLFNPGRGDQAPMEIIQSAQPNGSETPNDKPSGSETPIDKGVSE